MRSVQINFASSKVISNIFQAFASDTRYHNCPENILKFVVTVKPPILNSYSEPL